MAYECLQNSIESNLAELQKKIYKNPPKDILKFVEELWNDIKRIIQQIRNVFLYMDKKYILQKNLKPIIVLGYEIFQKGFFKKDNPISKAFIKKIIEMVKAERQGEKIN
jgi:hypothetical protein